MKFNPILSQAWAKVMPFRFQISLRSLTTIALGLLSLGLFSGCASILTGNQDHVYEYQYKNRFVRLEPIESGAQSNDHPQKIPPQQLHSQLSTVKIAGVDFSEATQLFTDDEINELAPRLSSALSKATPGQDISFQSAGLRGFLGKYSPASFTTGRLFVHNGRIHLIIGVAHTPIDLDTSREEFFSIGSRDSQADSSWKIKPGEGYLLNDKRSDWISFPLTLSTAEKTTQ